MATGGGSWIRVNATDLHLDARSMNAVVTDVLGRKADSITKYPDLRQSIGQLYVFAVSPYVPYNTGKLQGSGHATNDGRAYWTAISPVLVSPVDGHTYGGYNYAGIQYEVPMHHTTPGTTDHWTDKVKPGTTDWQQFIETIRPVIIRRFNK